MRQENVQKTRSSIYPGPRPFEPHEADLFFGRNREVVDLYNLASTYRVTVLYSQSGAGKTSLVNAGLLPRLQGTYGVLRARVGGALPPTIQLGEVKNVYAFSALVTSIGAGKDLSRYADAPLSEHFGISGNELVIFDQFEELFTSFPDRWRDREPFFEQLKAALQAREGLQVLFVIREDHL